MALTLLDPPTGTPVLQVAGFGAPPDLSKLAHTRAWDAWFVNLKKYLKQNAGVQFVKYPVSLSGGQWNVGGSLVGAAASHTQALYLTPGPVQACYLHWILKTGTPFSGGGMAAANCTIGSAAGGSTFFSPALYDLMAAAGDANYFEVAGPIMATFAADSTGIVVHADQNWNTAGIAGSLDVYLLAATFRL